MTLRDMRIDAQVSELHAQELDVVVKLIHRVTLYSMHICKTRVSSIKQKYRIVTVNPGHFCHQCYKNSSLAFFFYQNNLKNPSFTILITSHNIPYFKFTFLRRQIYFYYFDNNTSTLANKLFINLFIKRSRLFNSQQILYIKTQLLVVLFITSHKI